MKTYVYLMAMLLSVSAYAHDKEITIDNSSELLEWCKAESVAHFVGIGVIPYNWTADWWEEGNILKVKGSWLVGSDYVDVNCRVAKGARKKYAVYEISDRNR